MQSMEEIYQQYAQTVYRYLFSLVRDPDLAEELTQETFCQAIRSIDRYDESCKITTWLCAIAKNALRTHRRKHPPTEAIEDQPLQTPSAEAEAISADIEKAYDFCDVECHSGGQPLYYYLISVE